MSNNLQRIGITLGTSAILIGFTACGGGGKGSNSAPPAPNVSDYLLISLDTAGKVTTSRAVANSEVLPGPSANQILFRRIKGGTATLGSSKTEKASQTDEVPRTVTVGDFLISVYEITQDQWRYLTGRPSWQAPDEEAVGGEKVLVGNLPAFGLSYQETLTGINSFNQRNPVTYRIGLPTDDQWEFACRGNKSSMYSWGGNWGDDESPATIAKYAVVAESATLVLGPQAAGSQAPNGTFAATRLPNSFGLYDMHGNVWEWVNSTGQPTGRAILRGGSWQDNLISARSANKWYVDSDAEYALAGVRLTIVVTQ